MKRKTVHDVWIHDLDFLSRPGYSWIERHRLNFRCRRLCRRAETVIVPSRSVADDVVRYYFVPKEKIRIIPPTEMPQNREWLH